MRAIILLLLFSAAAGLACAQEFPQVPDSPRILSAEEVKNYWVNKMPEPREPSRLARNYKTEHLQYLEKVGRRHRLIAEIRRGQHDDLAKIVALRHNIQAHLLDGEPAKADALRAELAQLEGAARRDELLELERANAERLDRLIAATERLAAAIENNAGFIPPDVEADVVLDDEIIPFERDRDRDWDRVDAPNLVIGLRDEITAFRHRPVIVHRGNPTRIRPSHVHARTGTTTKIHGRSPSVQQPAVRQPAVRQPAVRQPAVQQPAVRQPAVRPVRVPQVRQPQRKISPSVRPRQPQRQRPVRPSPSVQPRQPQVRPPQIRPAR